MKAKKPKFLVCTASKGFGEQLMKRSGLLQYVEGNKKLRIVIDYDPKSGEGWMNAFTSCPIYQGHMVD